MRNQSFPEYAELVEAVRKYNRFVRAWVDKPWKTRRMRNGETKISLLVHGETVDGTHEEVRVNWNSRGDRAASMAIVTRAYELAAEQGTQ